MDSVTHWTQPHYTARELVDLLNEDQPEDQRLYPTAEQAAIIESGPEPMLVVAGAGSGKTHTMTDRVVWLVANGFVRPEEILGVTFTRKAAGELSERINTAIDRLARHPHVELPWEGEDLGRAQVSTYHSYANTLVGDHGLRIGVEPDAALMGEAQSFQLATTVVRSTDTDLSFSDIAFSTVVKAVRTLAGECAEHLVEPEEVVEFIDRVHQQGEALPLKGNGNQRTRNIFTMLKTRRVFAELVSAYQQAKRDANVMDYGDLVAHAARIARTLPEVGQAERNRYKVVLLDEFQDTSHAQMELFSGLFGASAGEGIGHPVTAVGDPNQSIYGFRGASAGQLFEFTHRFPVVRRQQKGTEKPDLTPAPTLQLTTAWRNAVHILDGANHIAEKLRSSGASIPQLQSRPAAPTGQILASWFNDSVVEDHAVAELFRERLEQDPDTTGAILCRRRAQFEPLMLALDHHGVPYEVLGLSGLLSTPEVTEIVALLRVISDPTRSDSLMRIMTNPRWRIGPADLWVLQQYARQLNRKHGGGVRAQGVSADEEVDDSSLIEALHHLPDVEWTSKTGHQFSAEGHRRLTLLRQELQDLSTKTPLHLPVLIRHIERVCGIGVEVAARPEATLASARRHLDRFLEAAEEFSATSDAVAGDDLSAFLAWLEMAEEEESGLSITPHEARPGAVQLLTVHSSKGLEWDAVAVPGLVDGDFPTRKGDVWTTEKSASLPWDLRGDRESLPQWQRESWETLNHWADSALGWGSKKDAEIFPPALPTLVKEHVHLEERRLAYVAYTRARTMLWISGSQWSAQRKTAFEPSPFLLEMVDHPAVKTGTWVSQEDVTDENPYMNQRFVALWPFDPLDGPQITQETVDSGNDSADTEQLLPARSRPRRAALEQAAAWVKTSMKEEHNSPDLLETISDPELAEHVQWILDRRHHSAQFRTTVELPGHISTSTFVDLNSDPDTVARQLRRPMPRQPKPAARAGTVFHTWIEEHFGAQRPGMTGMLDFEDPHVAVDEEVETALGVDQMREAFLAGPWAQRTPAFIEAAVETTVAGITLRGRIDAVFRHGGDPQLEFDPDAQWELVDWKTGTVPRNQQEMDIKGLQLAVYQLAWSRLHNIPLSNISGRFVYITHGEERQLTTTAKDDDALAAELETRLKNALGR